MRSKIEEPLRTCAIKRCRDAFGIFESGDVYGQVTSYIVDSPWIVFRSHQYVDLMSVTKEPADKVGSHEPCCSRNDDTFHFDLGSAARGMSFTGRPRGDSYGTRTW